MADFVPSGYVMLKQAVDRIGRRLMPHQWLGHEIDLLRADRGLTEEPAGVGAEPAGAQTPAGRLNRAVSYLLHALRAGDVTAVVARSEGEVHAFPPSLWAEPGIRATFRSGELPVEFRVALEGHKAGAGRRWVLLPQAELRSLLETIAARRAPADMEARLRDWLATKIDEAAGKEPPTKKRIWTEAQNAFASRPSFRAFDRVWRATVPDEWRRPGRGPRAAHGAKPVE